MTTVEITIESYSIFSICMMESAWILNMVRKIIAMSVSARISLHLLSVWFILFSHLMHHHLIEKPICKTKTNSPIHYVLYLTSINCTWDCKAINNNAAKMYGNFREILHEFLINKQPVKPLNCSSWKKQNTWLKTNGRN